jgi:hypothetical protein
MPQQVLKGQFVTQDASAPDHTDPCSSGQNAPIARRRCRDPLPRLFCGLGFVDTRVVLHVQQQPGATSYPLVSYEYAVFSKKQMNPGTATAIRKFPLWCIEPSEDKAAILERVHFIPLPRHTWELSRAQIQMIK